MMRHRTVWVVLTTSLLATAEGFGPSLLTSSSPLGTTTSLQVASNTDFSSLTVPELKQLVKDAPEALKKSILFQLRRKQDQIENIENKMETASSPSTPTPLCDLQTLLRLASLTDTGGTAKAVIQSGECQLNGTVETRRAKKLFKGDLVTFEGSDYNVEEIVKSTNYVYKPKKKHKMLPNGGRYRSEEWRAQRKERKAAGYGSDEWRIIQREKKTQEKQAKIEVKSAVKMIYNSFLTAIEAEESKATNAQKHQIFGEIWQKTYNQNCSDERLLIKIGILKRLISYYKEQSGASLSNADMLVITGGKNPDDLLESN